MLASVQPAARLLHAPTAFRSGLSAPKPVSAAPRRQRATTSRRSGVAVFAVKGVKRIDEDDGSVIFKCVAVSALHTNETETNLFKK